ncbi:MAG TPA: biopolymer transporter ExbD [Gammaproteobacteria bacterium]|nr:biopolymer transporter ExbD [Gammaproteobacteria bacterium]
MKLRHRGQADEADIDMTPMLDVVFIMLIFFIVTTSFASEVGLDVKRPTTNANTQQQKVSEVIVLEVRSDGRIIMDGRLINLASVEANIARARAGNPDAPVIVVIDKGANVQYMVAVLDQAKAAGAENVSIAARASD